MNIESVITSAGLACVAIIVAGVQIFFHTNTFKQEYEDSVKRLIAESSNKLQKEMNKLECFRKDSIKVDVLEEDLFPELGYDLAEEALAKIREISVDVEFWLKAIEDGKKILRWISISLILLASVLFVAVFIFSLYGIGYGALIVEYVGGPCLLGVVYNVNRYFKLVRRLDEENIRLNRSKTKAYESGG